MAKAESIEAPELEEPLFDAVRDELRAVSDANDVQLASVTIDILRAIIFAGYCISKKI